MNSPRARLWALAAAAALLPSQARAMLYSATQGYNYTSGAHGYAGHELWTAAAARLEGGWYPTARFSYASDSTYQRILAPGVGLEKGLAGIGRVRMGYVYYVGGLSRDQQASTHAMELGFFRALSSRMASDVSYRLMNGNLFSTAYVFETAIDDGASPLVHSVYHEGAMSLSYLANMMGYSPRLSAGVAVDATTHARSVLGESLGLSLPLMGGFSVDTTLAFHQGHTAATYVSGGLTYGFGGKR